MKANLVGYLGQYVLSAAINIVVGPILLQNLGSQNFGTWRLAQRFIDVFAFVDGRSGQALKIILAQAEGRSVPGVWKRSAVSAAINGWLLHLPLMIFVGAVAILAFPGISGTATVSQLNLGSESSYVAAVLFLTIFFNVFFAVPDATLTATGKSYLSSAAQALGLVLAALVSILASSSEYWHVLLPLSSLSMILISATGCHLLCRKYVGWYGISRISSKIRKTVVSFSVRTALWSLVEKLFLAIDILLIGYAAGVAAVASYNFTSYLSQFSISVAVFVTSARMPALVQDIARGKTNDVRDAIMTVRRINLLLAVVFGFITLFFSGYIIEIWVGRSHYGGLLVDIALCAYTIQTVVIRTDAQLLDAVRSVLAKAVVLGASVFVVVVIVVLMAMGSRSVEVWQVLAGIVLVRFPVLLFMRRHSNFLLLKDKDEGLRGLFEVKELLIFMAVLCGIIIRYILAEDNVKITGVY